MFHHLIRLAFLTILAASSTALAAEEALDLDSEVSAPAPTSRSSAERFSLMGRVDLTSEINPYRDQDAEKPNTLKNNHFLIFLKVKASEKTSFMGEFVGRSFFHVDYKANSLVTASFGKILIPFGDTRYFHHFYGGIQGYGATGVMFPNIWAEPGVNLTWDFGRTSLDTYWVNSISSANKTSDPDLQTSTDARQAGGARLTLPLGGKLTAIASGYFGETWPGRPLLIGGGDLYSDYGLLSWLKAFRFSMGLAHASIKKAPTKGDFEKRGDYLQVATSLIGPGELRARFGSYVDNSRERTARDTHSFNTGYSFSVDVIRVLAEYQWNFEAKNEVDNDVARIMASLDF